MTTTASIYTNPLQQSLDMELLNTHISTEFQLATAARINSNLQHAAWTCRDTRGAYKRSTYI